MTSQNATMHFIMNISQALNFECICSSKQFKSTSTGKGKDIFLLTVILDFVPMPSIHANAEMQRCSPLICCDTQLPTHTTAASAWLILCAS